MAVFDGLQHPIKRGFFARISSFVALFSFPELFRLGVGDMHVYPTPNGDDLHSP